MKAVEVSIMGQKFMVRSESSEDYIQQVSKFVDNKVTEIMHKTCLLYTSDAADE